MIRKVVSWIQFQWDSNFGIKGTERITYVCGQVQWIPIRSQIWYQMDRRYLRSSFLRIQKFVSWHRNDTTFGIMIPMRFQFWYQRDRRYNICSVKYRGFQNWYHDTTMIRLLESWFQWDSNFDIRGTEGITYLRSSTGDSKTCIMTPEWYQYWNHDSNEIPILISEGQKV